jgi:O-antigen/teichoic acid export membrane protein
MNLSSKIAYNTLIQVISKIIATILGLFTIAIITRYLGQTGFGEYTTIIAFTSIFAIIADLGLTLVTAQMISQPGADQEKILKNLFGLRLISAIISLVPAPLVVIFFPYAPIVKWGVAITAFSFLFSSLNQIPVGIFQKKLRMDKVSFAEVAGRIILFLGTLIAVRFNYGLLGIMFAAGASNILSFALHYIFAAKFAKIGFAFDKIIWREIIKKSWPIALTIALNLIYLKTDTLILSLVKPQAAVGIYGAAYKVIDVVITLPFMFAGVILPIMTASWAEKNNGKFKESMQKSFDFMAITAMPLVFGAQFTARPLMTLVAGKEFAESGEILKILILAAGAIFLGSIFSHGIIAINKQKKIIGAYLFTAITAVAAYIIFIPRFSYFGAAWATVYSETMIAFFSAYFIWKYAGFLPNLKIFFKSLVASIVMGVFLFLIGPENFSGLKISLAIGAAGLLYFAILYFIKGITRGDLLILKK